MGMGMDAMTRAFHSISPELLIHYGIIGRVLQAGLFSVSLCYCSTVQL